MAFVDSWRKEISRIPIESHNEWRCMQTYARGVADTNMVVVDEW